MTDDVELSLGPTLDFLRRVWALNHAIERVSAHMAATLGITAQQRMIIRCVAKYPGITAGNLARQLHADPGTISAAIARLERRRLIERRRDPRDRRRVTVGLTAAGRSFDRPADHTVERGVELLLRTVPASQLGIAVDVIATLTRLLDEEAEVDE